MVGLGTTVKVALAVFPGGINGVVVVLVTALEVLR